MCNLYSMTKNVDAIRKLFGGRNNAGNMPSLPGIFPDYPRRSCATPTANARSR